MLETWLLARGGLQLKQHQPSITGS